MNYLCKNYPLLMRPLLTILLITGILSIISLLSVLIENFYDVVAAHKEVFKYIKNGETE